MNLTVFGLLVPYGVASGAIMATSVFMTSRILRPKCSGPKVVILSGAYYVRKKTLRRLQAPYTRDMREALLLKNWTLRVEDKKTTEILRMICGKTLKDK